MQGCVLLVFFFIVLQNLDWGISTWRFLKYQMFFIASPHQCRDGATRIRTYSSVFIYIIYIYIHCHDVSLWAYKVRHLKVMLASFLANKKNIVLNQIRDASKIDLFTAYILKKNAGGLTAISWNLYINLLIKIFSCCPICIDHWST